MLSLLWVLMQVQMSVKEVGGKHSVSSMLVVTGLDA